MNPVGSTLWQHPRIVALMHLSHRCFVMLDNSHFKQRSCCDCCVARKCHRLQKECQTRRHDRCVFSSLRHKNGTERPALTTQLSEDVPLLFSVSTRGLNSGRTVWNETDMGRSGWQLLCRQIDIIASCAKRGTPDRSEVPVR